MRKAARRRASFLALPLLFAAAFTAVCSAAVSGAKAEPIDVSAEAVPLDPTAPSRKSVGKLRFRAGYVLHSEHRRFGGLSALLVSDDGQRMVALTDNGYRLDARLTHSGDDTLTGLFETELSPLRGPDGDPLTGKSNSDAESLAASPAGGLIAAFERKHRLLHYPGGGLPPVDLQPPRELPLAPGNDGIEALTLLKDGRLMAITEGFRTQYGVIGWIGDGKTWDRFTYESNGIFSPTGAATLPNGDVLLVERHYSLFNGTAIRISRIGKTAFVPGARIASDVIAELRPPMTVDNIEGISVRTGSDGALLVYLLSDDNFDRADQRTLLLQFELTAP